MKMILEVIIFIVVYTSVGVVLEGFLNIKEPSVYAFVYCLMGAIYTRYIGK